MAYKPDELLAATLQAIEENNLMFFADIAAYIDCSERTLYNHKLQEVQEVKEALSKNRLRTKQSLRAKWYRSDNATLQVALYKLLGDQEEVARLSNSPTSIHVTDADKVEVRSGFSWDEDPYDTGSTSEDE